MNSFIPFVIGYIITVLFYKDSFGVKLFAKIDLHLIQETKQNQILKSGEGLIKIYFIEIHKDGLKK